MTRPARATVAEPAGAALRAVGEVVAAMAAALGGIDVLVFTGGVGEHSPAIRARTADGLGFLGVRVDPAANAAPGGDAEITDGGGLVRTLVLQAREDLEMARQAVVVLTRPDTAA